MSTPMISTMHAELTAADPALVRNEDVLRGVLAGCGDCIKILDLDGRLQFMSDGGKRVMEVDDFSKLKGCPWPDFWEGQGNADAANAVAQARIGKTARFRGPANTARGNSRYWDVTVSPIVGEGGATTHLLSISRDITEEWQAAEHRKFLVDELQHRVKNMLQTVIAIAGQTFKDEDYREPRDAFVARLAALDRVHSLLNDPKFGTASVGTIIEGALGPHLDAAESMQVAGPDVALGAKQALALALAANELATNAAKYGALSSPDGRVNVGWRLEDGNFHLDWRETGGPAVTPPSRIGFGTRVIRNLLADELRGTVTLDYAAEGLHCHVTAPVKQLTT